MEVSVGQKTEKKREDEENGLAKDSNKARNAPPPSPFSDVNDRNVCVARGEPKGPHHVRRRRQSRREQEKKLKTWRSTKSFREEWTIGAFLVSWDHSLSLLVNRLYSHRFFSCCCVLSSRDRRKKKKKEC
ncbi:Protein CBG25576 [Caenorhabditis briggsae]|uniref:Protein CBG25576 n=1 Tax=Caenorhabditis briggsae TaxID=6238 RepID=B6IF63_CAEBR|nr:Protein CBG25576 [Caenorhabditis briggsae]CAR98543.1 Protein CBG25576 [Caenorhabditis briggsae]